MDLPTAYTDDPLYGTPSENADVQDLLLPGPPTFIESPLPDVPTGQLPQKYTADVFSYAGYDVTVRYVHKPGVVILPLAVADTTSDETVVVSQVSAPRTYKVVRFSGVRYGDYPQIPNPTATDTNLTLVSAKVKLHPVILDALGEGQVYKVTGRYVYVMRVPWPGGFTPATAPPDAMTLKGVPVPYTTAIGFDLDAESFVDNII